MKYLLLLIFLPLSARAIDHAEYSARIQRMVASGAITQEAANVEKVILNHPDKRALTQRGAAQRSLASVTPSLKPLKIKRFKAKPMVLTLD